MNEDQFEKLSRQIDVVIRLLLNDSLEGKNLTERVLFLRGAGLRNIEIASLLDTSQEYVSVVIGRQKRKPAEKAKPRRPYRGKTTAPTLGFLGKDTATGDEGNG